MHFRGRLHGSLCVLYVLLTLLVYPIADSPENVRGLFYGLLNLALSGVMLAVWSISVHRDPSRWGVVVAGVVARVAALGCPPFTSTDALRYLWDGQVFLSGLDPYRVVPVDAEGSLPSGWTLPPHPETPTVYPPAAILSFALAARFGPEHSYWVWKAMLLAASTAIVIVGWRLLRQHNAERHVALLALSPLLVLEGAVGAHVDILATLFLSLAIAAGIASAASWVSPWWALGFLTKFSPALGILPALVGKKRRHALRVVMVTLVVTSAGYAAFLLLGIRPLGSLFSFFAGSRFGSPWFALLEALCGGHALAAALALGVLLLGVSVWVGSRHCRIRGIQLAVAAPFLLSPVVFPWYLCPLVPLVAMKPSAALLAWVITAPLTYEVVNSHSWEPAAWPLVIAGGATLAGVWLDVAMWRGHRPRDGHTETRSHSADRELPAGWARLRLSAYRLTDAFALRSGENGELSWKRRASDRL